MTAIRSPGGVEDQAEGGPVRGANAPVRRPVAVSQSSMPPSPTMASVRPSGLNAFVERVGSGVTVRMRVPVAVSHSLTGLFQRVVAASRRPR